MTRATTVDDQLCLSGCAGDGTIKCGGHSSRPGDYVRRAAVYRLTPLGVTGLADKDSGDPTGDVYFGLEEKITPMHCRKNPGFYKCKWLNGTVGGSDTPTNIYAQIVEAFYCVSRYVSTLSVCLSSASGLSVCLLP
jgi:hypothetical protein